jgi:hypothetical protein
MSKIQVDAIEQQTACGTTLTAGGGAGKTVVVDATTVTLGRCGGTVALASGASQTGFGRTGTVNWDTTPKTSTVTAANGVGYFVNTTAGSVTVNLPAGTAGDIVAIADYANTADTNKIAIAANGSEKIQGVASNPFEITVEGGSVTLVYVDSTQGWRPTDASTAAAITENDVFIVATGGTIATCGDYKIHTFTGPGTFCVSAAGGPVAVADYMVVAGGGGAAGGVGNYAAGAGAGGFRESSGATSGGYSTSPLGSGVSALPVSVSGFPITVGAGGAGCVGESDPGNNGNPSIFSSIISAGGGWGQPGNPSPTGGPGGSGGGGGTAGGTGNTPPVSPPQGNPGGTQAGSPPNYGRGGGGGATAAGSNGAPTSGGNGGNGATTSISTSPTTYAGGGGAGVYLGGTGGNGGTGGGGNGANGSPPTTAQAGSGNSGGGAGGQSLFPGGPSGNGKNGGSGIVIIRYKFQ